VSLYATVSPNFRSNQDIHTLGIYAKWCAAKDVGFPRVYFDRLPKNMYIGQSDAFQKLVRCIESDQSIMAATTVSNWHPASHGWA